MKTETPIVIDCAGDQMVGIVHPGGKESRLGVVIVVGGPQYRAGSHRQFVVMARAIAAQGVPVLRFDYRGMGDSDGAPRSFDDVNADIAAAIDALRESVPALEHVVLLGLCDAASANLIYAAGDQRVRGLVLMNPWVRTQQGEARAYVRHYYLQRLLQKSFWKKWFSGEFEFRQSMSSFFTSIRNATGRSGVAASTDDTGGNDFISRMLSGFRKFSHPVLLLISERDLTANEFVDLCSANPSWRACVRRKSVTTLDFPGADHTMSSRSDLDGAIAAINKWLVTLVNSDASTELEA